MYTLLCEYLEVIITAIKSKISDSSKIKQHFGSLCYSRFLQCWERYIRDKKRFEYYETADYGAGFDVSYVDNPIDISLGDFIYAAWRYVKPV